DMDTVKVCTGYRLNGKLLRSFPADTDMLDKIKPVYKTMNGWSKKDIDNLKKGIFAKSIKDYIKLTEKFTGAKIVMLSTGPSRKDIVFIEKI
ncbi:adenylosuccinate synthetase, partial [candidate division WOR-3 bacterium]|nr:adenylosuccinate synthetase [candidate division WOR-3 bacterium]